MVNITECDNNNKNAEVGGEGNDNESAEGVPCGLAPSAEDGVQRVECGPRSSLAELLGPAPYDSGLEPAPYDSDNDSSEEDPCDSTSGEGPSSANLENPTRFINNDLTKGIKNTNLEQAMEPKEDTHGEQSAAPSQIVEEDEKTPACLLQFAQVYKRLTYDLIISANQIDNEVAAATDGRPMMQVTPMLMKAVYCLTLPSNDPMTCRCEPAMQVTSSAALVVVDMVFTASGGGPVHIHGNLPPFAIRMASPQAAAAGARVLHARLHSFVVVRRAAGRPRQTFALDVFDFLFVNADRQDHLNWRIWYGKL